MEPLAGGIASRANASRMTSLVRLGTYAKDGMRMTVSLDGDMPKAQLAGQPAFDIFAESPSRFFLKVVDATLVFAPESGRPDTATLHQGGQELVFTRQE